MHTPLTTTHPPPSPPPPKKNIQTPPSPHLARLVIWDEDEALDAASVAALQAANPRVHVTVHARLVPAPAL